MAFKIPFLPPVRLNSPYWQNVLMGVIVGLSAGMYQSMNSLGAGGLRQNSAHMVQIVNATLCATWFLASMFCGTVLNLIGPSFTAFLGVVGYAAYVAGIWYFDKTGLIWFPILGGVLIGIGAGLIFVVQGSIAMSYSEEEERGSFITMSTNLQAVGAAVAGLIDVGINHNKAEAAGVPIVVYIIILALMACAAAISFLLLPPDKVVREDGTHIAKIRQRGAVEELRASYETMKNWDLLILIPAFLPSECYLVFGGSVNAFSNNLRTRTLLSFIAVVLQIPAAYCLKLILDHKGWRRRTRALAALTVTGVPLVGAWIWQMVHVRNWDRHHPPTHAIDWTDHAFIQTFFLFTLTWVASALFQYTILYYLSCLTNSPSKAGNYAGVFRSFLAAGEAINFGVDSTTAPYLKIAAVLFTLYTAGVISCAYLGIFHITETKYFNEDDVVIPQHVLAEHHIDGVVAESDGVVAESEKGAAVSVAKSG